MCRLVYKLKVAEPNTYVDCKYANIKCRHENPKINCIFQNCFLSAKAKVSKREQPAAEKPKLRKQNKAVSSLHQLHYTLYWWIYIQLVADQNR